MDVSRKILLNLVLRYRTARKFYKRMTAHFGPKSIITRNADAIAREAWNSYQAAKQIYYRDQNE